MCSEVRWFFLDGWVDKLHESFTARLLPEFLDPANHFIIGINIHEVHLGVRGRLGLLSTTANLVHFFTYLCFVELDAEVFILFGGKEKCLLRQRMLGELSEDPGYHVKDNYS